MPAGLEDFIIAGPGLCLTTTLTVPLPDRFLTSPFVGSKKEDNNFLLG